MTTEKLRPWLHAHWPEVRAALDAGTYRPGPRPPDPDPQARGCLADFDLEVLFHRVNHDALMTRVARRVTNKKVLKLLRTYLTAGVMAEGVHTRTEEGTPQGSPLSPLLANIMLDDLDHELAPRGHTFVRYADDVMIYVRNKRAGERVMTSTRKFVAKRLKLIVNEAKSAA